MEKIIIKQCRFQGKDQPTVAFKHNAACIRQMSIGLLRLIEKNILIVIYLVIHKI